MLHPCFENEINCPPKNAPNDLKDTDFVFTFFFQNCSRFQNVTVLCSRLHAGQVAEGSFEECILSVGQTEI